MSRFHLALVLLLALFSFAASDTLVTDSVGSGLSLPTTGGHATSYLTVLSSQVSTSPYRLYVSVSERSSASSAVESFHLSPPSAGPHNSTQPRFGNATLISQHFSPLFAKDAGIAGSYLRNASQPNTAAGTYTFVFNIPVLTTLRLNLTYTSTSTTTTTSGNHKRTHLRAVPAATERIELAIFNPLSSIVVDPQFIGLRGQQYAVHGLDGAVYNIISEEAMQVNSRFVFLVAGAGGDCAGLAGGAAAGRADVGDCRVLPGSYVGEMGFQAVVDGQRHSALVTAGSAKTGFASVHVDRQTLAVGDKVSYGDFTIHLQTSHLLFITTESFDFQLSNADQFISQKLRPRVALSELKAHGLIGQTHSTVTYPTNVRYIEGDVDDYIIGDNDIFGTDFVYNRFLA